VLKLKKNQFSKYTGTKIWNAISEEIRRGLNFRKFAKEYKK